MSDDIIVSVINNLPNLISSIFTGILLVLTWYRTGVIIKTNAIAATEAKAAVTEINDKVDEVHHMTNGKMEELLKLSTRAARAEGRLEGPVEAPKKV